MEGKEAAILKNREIKQPNQVLDSQKIAMHAALEAGGLDLFKRASYLNQEQAKEAIAVNQGQPTY